MGDLLEFSIGFIPTFDFQNLGVFSVSKCIQTAERTIFPGDSLLLISVSQIPFCSKLSVVSSNGEFACGFLNNLDQPNQYQNGIRFNSKSEQTVVNNLNENKKEMR